MANVRQLDFSKPADSDLLWDAITEKGASVLSLNGKVAHTLLYTATTYEFLVELETVFVVGPYLVAYAVHTPWYSDEEVLCDLIVMRLNDDPGSLSDVTNFLEDEARRLDVRWVAVGTLLAPQDQSLVRAYQRQGYEVAATQLVKEIT